KPEEPMRRVCWLALATFALSFHPARATSVSVLVPEAVRSADLRGRLLVVFAAKADPEPHLQVDGSYSSAQIFGIDVDAVPADGHIVVEQPDGWPVANLAS